MSIFTFRPIPLLSTTDMMEIHHLPEQEIIDEKEGVKFIYKVHDGKLFIIREEKIQNKPVSGE